VTIDQSQASMQRLASEWRHSIIKPRRGAKIWHHTSSIILPCWWRLAIVCRPKKTVRHFRSAWRPSLVVLHRKKTLVALWTSLQRLRASTVLVCFVALLKV